MVNHCNMALVTAPAVLPISVEDAKLQVRETSTAHDNRLYDLVAQATSHVENVTGNKLVQQIWDIYYPGFGELVIPIGPVISLDAFEYTDEDGTATAVSASLYALQSKRPPWCSKVYLKPNQSWPTANLYNVDPLRIRVKVGWADEETQDAADANTTTTELVMASHGLTNLDTIYNVDRATQRTARYINANTLGHENIVAQNASDVIRKFNTSKIPAVFRKAIKEMVGTQFELTDDVLMTDAGTALQEMPPWAARTTDPLRMRGV